MVVRKIGSRIDSARLFRYARSHRTQLLLFRSLRMVPVNSQFRRVKSESRLVYPNTDLLARYLLNRHGLVGFGPIFIRTRTRTTARFPLLYRPLGMVLDGFLWQRMHLITLIKTLSFLTILT